MSGAFADPGRRERPTTPDESYGVPRRGGTMIEWRWVIERLRETAEYWLSTVTPDGRPHVAPIWGVLVDDDLYLETSPATRKARNVAANPRVAVHVSEGSAVVIINGEAHPFGPPESLGPALASEFKRKYAGYEPTPTDWDGGGLYRVQPRTVIAWREMSTATRWRLGR